MPLLRPYAELGHICRTEPCQEYPGEWLLSIPEGVKSHVGEHYTEKHDSRLAAISAGDRLLSWLEYNRVEYNPRDVGVYWKCSDNDPRVGQVWFTPYYKDGNWTFFGGYKQT